MIDKGCTQNNVLQQHKKLHSPHFTKHKLQKKPVHPRSHCYKHVKAKGFRKNIAKDVLSGLQSEHKLTRWFIAIFSYSLD